MPSHLYDPRNTDHGEDFVFEMEADGSEDYIDVTADPFFWEIPGFNRKP